MSNSTDKGNTTRLSLALIDLPLTPFGMKSPFSNSKNKILLENGENRTKPSLLQLKSLKKVRCLSPVEEKENFNFPTNLKNVNMRRRYRNKSQEENARDNYNFQQCEVESATALSKHNLQREKRDSLFTDIDDGSFIEFTGKPSSEKALPQFYYTCTDDNETRYSTSSKMPLSPVGFRKFIDAVKNKYSLNNIVEETLLQTEKDKITFDLDESVIAGSRDIMDFKRRHKNFKNVLNSTAYNNNTKIVHELPDLSSLTIDDMSPHQISVKAIPTLNHVSPKRNFKKPFDSKVSIVISDDENEFQFSTKKNEEQFNRNSKIDKSKHSPTKKKYTQKEVDLESSLISEDISLLPSVPERRTHINSPLKTPLKAVSKISEHSINKGYQVEREIEENRDCHIPEVDDRVVGWVLNSPFKDGSFGTSFDVNEDVPPNFPKRNMEAFGMSSQSLDLRLSDDLSGGGSGKTVFTLGRVAESPDIEDVVPFNRNPLISSDNDSSHEDSTSPSYGKQVTRKILSERKLQENGNKSKQDPKKPEKSLYEYGASPLLRRLSASSEVLHDCGNLRSNLKEKTLVDVKRKLIQSNDDKTDNCSRNISGHILLTEENKNSEDFPHDTNKRANRENRHLGISGIKFINDDEYPAEGELLNISPCKRKSKSQLNFSRSKSDTELNRSKSLDRMNLLENACDKVSIAREATLLIDLTNENNFVEDKSSKVDQATRSFICIDTSYESLPDIDLKRLLEKPKLSKQFGSCHKSVIVPDSESDPEHQKNGSCHTPNGKHGNFGFVTPTVTHLNVSKEKNKNNNLKHLPSTVYESNSDSSEDNFENYINSLKKTQNKNKKVYGNQNDDDFIVSDDDNDIDYYSSPVMSNHKNRERKISKETKKTDDLNRKNLQRVIISASSDSEEDVVHSIPKRKTNPKITKPKSVIKKQVPIEKPLAGYEPLSFLSSLTQDTSLSKAHVDAVPFLKNFKKTREALSTKLYTLFNEHVFKNQLPSSMNIKWNSRMTKTAGFCYCQLDKSKSCGRGARIELSSKVIDDPGRLRDTLVHEMCHAASWVVSGYKDGHGPIWKSWASKAMKAFPELPLIRRCHSYKINYKYTYKCVNCGYSIGRHSKSLDTEKNACGYCYGKFELLVKYVRKGSESRTKASNPLLKGALSTPRTPSSFALYVKDNYGSIKKSQTGMKHKDVMKALSDQFSKMKTKN